MFSGTTQNVNSASAILHKVLYLGKDTDDLIMFKNSRLLQLSGLIDSIENVVRVTTKGTHSRYLFGCH